MSDPRNQLRQRPESRAQDQHQRRYQNRSKSNPSRSRPYLGYAPDLCRRWRRRFPNAASPRAWPGLRPAAENLTWRPRHHACLARAACSPARSLGEVMKRKRADGGELFARPGAGVGPWLAGGAANATSIFTSPHGATLLGTARAREVVIVAPHWRRSLAQKRVHWTHSHDQRDRVCADVLRIGGVKERVLAAIRFGLKHVVLPEGNRSDSRQMYLWRFSRKSAICAIDDYISPATSAWRWGRNEQGQAGLL